MCKPLIKWPGGKSSELEYLKDIIPEFKRYIEPFFGGGAAFFDIRPKKAIINDISINLAKFYQYIKEENNLFKNALYGINSFWENYKIIARQQADKLVTHYIKYKNNIIDKLELNKAIEQKTEFVIVNTKDKAELNINAEKLLHEINRMVKDKIFRTVKNEIRANESLSNNDLIDNIQTGFTSGFYMYFRSWLNDMDLGKDTMTNNETHIAVFYYVREFCYGSMFRYNSHGEFNIPYGGIAYNNKDFKRKIDYLFSEEIIRTLKNADIMNADFEEIIDDLTNDDFMFLDPPYDTDFSDYEGRSFNRDDQKRLAGKLMSTKAKFVLIIKNTPFIHELYDNKKFNITTFDNQYAYCVKGRNHRDAEHLVVSNY